MMSWFLYHRDAGRRCWRVRTPVLYYGCLGVKFRLRSSSIDYPERSNGFPQ